MINPGDIVYRLRKGGFIHDRPVVVKDNVGLVIKERRKIKPTEVPQYYVQFNKETPKWYYQHDLHKIGGERNEDAILHNQHSRA